MSSPWLAFFYDYLALERRYSAHTVAAYRNDLAAYCTYLSSQHLDGPEQANHHDVRGWLLQLADSGIAAKSVNRKIAALRAFYTYLRRQGAVKTSPMQSIKPLRTPSRMVRYITDKDADLSVAPKPSAAAHIQLRDALIVELFYGTGIRRAELIGLSVASYDIAKATLRVLGKRSKTRIIPLHAGLPPLLSAYMVARKEALGAPGQAAPLLVTDKGQGLYPMLVQRVVAAALASVPNLDKKSPHVLRHTFATHLLNNGAELKAIKELLGHASLAATQVYTHNSIDRLMDIYKQAHPKGS